jgi:putative transposase
MTRDAYPTDVTDDEWQVMEPLIPPAKSGGRPRGVDLREIINDIRYVLSAGCAWRLVPYDLPPWETLSASCRRWKEDGTWERINDTLRQRLRHRSGRHQEPCGAILDNQTVKTTELGGSRAMMPARRPRDGNGPSWLVPGDC